MSAAVLPSTRRFDGTRLRRARAILGLKQSEAAARVPTSQGRWSEYETGLREPSAATLPRVCAVVEIPIDFVFTTVEPETCAQ